VKPRWFDSLIFVLLVSGPPKFRGRDPLASLRGEIDASALFQIGVWALGFAYVVWRLYPLLSRGLLPRLHAVQTLALLIPVTLLIPAFASPGPAVTVFLVFQLAVMILFCMVFVERYAVEAFMVHLFWSCVILSVFVAGAWLISPSLVTPIGSDRLRGDLVAPVGALAAVTFVLLLSGAVLLRRWYFLALCALLALLLFSSQTRTAFGALAVFVALGAAFGQGLPVRRAVPVLLLGLLGLGAFDALTATGQYVVREQQSIATMSDRVPLWSHLVSNVAAESPLVGIGYVSGSRILAPQYNRGLGNAHSAYVEVFVGGGVLSTGLLLSVIAGLTWSIGRLLFRRPGDTLVIAAAGVFVVVGVTAVTTSEAFMAGPLGLAFWSLVAVVPKLASRFPGHRGAAADSQQSHTGRTGPPMQPTAGWPR
jgi:O-antigen ligase